MARRRRTRTRDARIDTVRGLLLVAVGAGLVAGLDNLPAPLGPSRWHGFGVTDLVAGAFPVVAGVAIGWHGRHATARRLGRRLLVLGGIGLLLSLALHGVPWIWTGPLQQLAVASVAVGWLARHDRATRLAVGGALLAGQAWLLSLAPVSGAGSLRPSANAVAAVDQLLLPGHVLLPTDPWGPATLPLVVALVLAGHEVGTWLRSRPPGPATAAALVVLAAWLAVGGLGGALLVPVNRTLATPTWGLLSLAFVVGLLGVVHALRHLGAGRLLDPLATVGRHGLPVAVVLAAVGALVVGDGSVGPWRGLREGLLEPLAGDAWIWVYVAVGGVAAFAVARAVERRNWRLTA